MIGQGEHKVRPAAIAGVLLDLCSHGILMIGMLLVTAIHTFILLAGC